MKQILLTNDDGIHAPGIRALHKELKKVGDVIVVAPESEKSSVGHGITLTYPIWFKKEKFAGKFRGYSITGTPADCVKFATSVILKKKPDLVVSGINLGANDGCSVFYSGTVAAAREGAIMGIPSMAVSLGTFFNPDFRYCAKIAAKLAKLLLTNKLPKGTFLNVNVPNKPPQKIRGIKITQQGLVPIHGTFHKRTDPHLREYYWMSGKVILPSDEISSDTHALMKDYVTISPLHCDLTDYTVMEEIKGWKI